MVVIGSFVCLLSCEVVQLVNFWSKVMLWYRQQSVSCSFDDVCCARIPVPLVHTHPRACTVWCPSHVIRTYVNVRTGLLRASMYVMDNSYIMTLERRRSLADQQKIVTAKRQECTTHPHHDQLFKSRRVRLVWYVSHQTNRVGTVRDGGRYYQSNSRTYRMRACDSLYLKHQTYIPG